MIILTYATSKFGGEDVDYYCATDCIELKKIMAEQNIKNISELAKKSGVNRNTLSNVIRGEKQPSADVMEKLVITLNMEPARAGKVFFKRNLRNK